MSSVWNRLNKHGLYFLSLALAPFVWGGNAGAAGGQQSSAPPACVYSRCEGSDLWRQLHSCWRISASLPQP